LLYCRLELESSSKIKISPTEAKHQLDPNLGGGSMQGFDNALTENGLGRQRDSAILGCEVISKLRLPRSLLEKWVEEPFFEKAVVGCFVRLGVGMAPGTSEPQYKVLVMRVKYATRKLRYVRSQVWVSTNTRIHLVSLRPQKH